MRALEFRLELKEWWPWYDRIASSLGLTRADDQRATAILNDLLQGRGMDPSVLRALIGGKGVLVFGAGPSLEANILSIQQAGLLEKFTTITADGATTALLNIANFTPHVVATDLDGRLEDLIRANRRGSVIVIHGHGDNIPALLQHVPKFSKVMGTTQVEPRPNVHNFGGFTDGDRAVFLAAAMGARIIALAGMDLGREIGKYSKMAVEEPERKHTKLNICKQLLEWLASKTDAKLYNLTGRGEAIQGFQDTNPKELN